VKLLTSDEHAAVTAAFAQRLSDAMSNAGCNDVCRDEFPESVCARFKSDLELLESWEMGPEP
jgi:hypothetical protein